MPRKSKRRKRIKNQDDRQLTRKPSSGKYDKEVTPYVFESLLLRGYNFSQIAKFLKVSQQSLRTWLYKHKEMKEIYREFNKHKNQLEIEEALVKKAKGYHVKETRKELIFEMIKQPDGTYRQSNTPKAIKVIEQEKYIPPDLNAMKILLLKYDPEGWAELRDIDQITQVNTQVNVEMPKVVLGNPPEEIVNKKVVPKALNDYRKEQNK